MKERRKIKALSVGFDLESSLSTASFSSLNQEIFYRARARKKKRQKKPSLDRKGMKTASVKRWRENVPECSIFIIHRVIWIQQGVVKASYFGGLVWNWEELLGIIYLWTLNLKYCSKYFKFNACHRYPHVHHE